jgi:regulator of protease activity HflC (stomatin/prohibitin superfamily)
MFTIVLSLLIAFASAAGLYFVGQEKRDRSNTSDPYATIKTYPFRKVAFLPFVLPLIVFMFESFTVVPAGHVGVQVTLGEVNPVPLTEGVHFVNPLSSVRNVEVRVVKTELRGSSAGTKDLQVVHTDIVANYRIAGEKAAHMYKEFGLDLEGKILLPAMNESFKAETAHYNSEELVTKRAEVSSKIHQTLQEKVGKYGLTVSEISLVNFGFSPEYQAAIEQKVIATQSKLKAEQDLARIKVEAESRVAQAQGEAKAIAIQAQAIQTNGGQNYVQLQAIEKWNGKLPDYVGGGTIPFINIGK